MNIPFVDLKAQYQLIKDEIDQAISAVIAETSFINGPHAAAFEERFAAFCGTKYCVGVGNGTDAIFIILKALGIGPDDEVITAANSFVATSEAVTATGARVVFADVDKDFYTIDPARIEEKITHRTKAIIPVHLYGQPADMDAVLSIAEKHSLFVVEDAAQAHGAVYKGRNAGSIGRGGCFSFYPGKNLGAYGDAGAIVTNDEKLAKKSRMLANHGRVEKYNHEIEGYNSRMDGLQGAVLGVKLGHLDTWNEERRRVAHYYDTHLNCQHVTIPKRAPITTSVFHLYVIQAEQRDELRAYLADQGISTGIHYPIALPMLSAYKYMGHSENDFPVSVRLSKSILSLPVYPELDDEKLGYIVNAIHKFYNV